MPLRNVQYNCFKRKQFYAKEHLNTYTIASCDALVINYMLFFLAHKCTYRIISGMHTVLIVDDEELIRSLLVMAFEDDYEVHTCSDGLEAWTWFQHNSADLIITDIMMPHMDGIDLITAIRASLSSVPILAISGGNGGRISHQEDRLSLARDAGANECISKPFELRKLSSCVKNLLDNSTQALPSKIPYVLN